MYLVTGGNGFIGNGLVKILKREVLSYRIATRSASVNSVAVGDITGNTDWSTALQGVSTVIHLAALAHKISIEPTLDDFRRINVDASVNLARQSALAGAKRFLFVSSIGVLGQTTSLGQAFSDSSPPNPVSPYAISKFEAERALESLCPELGMELVVLRPPLVYGRLAKGNFGRLVQLVSSGYPLPFASISNRRSLISLENFCEAVLAGATKAEAANEKFVIAERETVSTADIIQAIADGLGVRTRLIPINPTIIEASLKLLGKSKISDSLLGSLEINSSRFYDTIGFRAKGKTIQNIKGEFTDSCE